ncbi:MAG: DUF3466 family protein [Phycisphaerales bacterium]|nr:DUF3466 family protein [Phycisphaerae bacterium]NNF41907.1 DUF3466 family protein [Phycisphaerales bacterium]NNM25523.1 DUF3466 family protein [Phycisphaerales bacterium]
MNGASLRRHGIGSAGLAFALAIAASTSAVDRIQFALTDLGTLGGDLSRALDMNDHGVIVGWSTTAESPRGERHAFVIGEEGMIDLGTLGGPWSEARAVNNAGQIVGVSTTPEGEEHAFYVYQDMLLDLNDLVPSVGRVVPNDSIAECGAPLRVLIEANGINDEGWIVACGYVEADDALHGFLLYPLMPIFPTEPMYRYIDLGQLPKASDCIATAISEDRTVVGMSGTQAFRYQDGVMEAIEDPDVVSMALAVSGEWTVGWIGPTLMQPHPTLWLGRQRLDLPVPGGGIGEANDLNDAGAVVGWAARDMGHPWEAMLWSDGRSVRLTGASLAPLRADDFGWSRLEEATAIDAEGRIVGSGRTLDGLARAFLLTPLELDPGD